MHDTPPVTDTTHNPYQKAGFGPVAENSVKNRKLFALPTDVMQLCNKRRFCVITKTTKQTEDQTAFVFPSPESYHCVSCVLSIELEVLVSFL